MCRLLMLLLLLASAGVRAAEPDLLEPEKAFQFSARLIDPGQVEVRYVIAPGYYLYREKFKFSAMPASVAVDGSQLPPGKVKKDEFFGEVQIYRGEQRFVLPVKGLSGESPAFKLNAVSQGCADIGVCYPPQEQSAELKLAAFTPAGSAPSA
jgi:thiol:disulfide interchange protein DsbD